MKKGIIVLLITVLAAGMVFADVTGSASFSAGFDLDDKVFTVDNSKTGNSTFKFDFAAESNEIAAVESGIYAKFGGSFEAYMTEGDLKVDFELSDATIQAVDGLWSVNLTKVANGVELTYAGNSLDVWYKNKLNWGANLTSKDFTIIEGLTISGKVGYAAAKNDLTDPDNYTYGFDQKTLDAIAKAQDTEVYFAKYDDGTYKNENLAAYQSEVEAAEKELKDAKEAFAKEPTAANMQNIEDCKDALASAKYYLSLAEAGVLAKFKAANSGDGKWYTESTTYAYSESWKIVDSDASSKPDPYIAKVVLPLEKTIYYIVRKISSGNVSYVAKVASENYVAGLGEEVVKTVKTGAKPKEAYLVGESTKVLSYKENEALYEFKADEGTSTINGGVKLAYSLDKISASLEANVAYELLAKETSYDFTLKGGYDFVKAETSFNSDKIFNVSASVKLDSLIGIPLSISGGVTDILSKGDDLRAYKGTLEVSVIGITAKAEGTFNTKVSKVNSRWAGKLTVSYAMEATKFTFSGALTKEAGIDKDTHNYGVRKLAFDPTFEVTNTALIDNATLSLKWTGAHFGGDATKASNGAVTASVSVKF